MRLALHSISYAGLWGQTRLPVDAILDKAAVQGYQGFMLVGKRPRRRSYYDALQSFFYEEGFTPAEVVFTGHVDHAELLACYAEADVFVSTSAHEGFGVPLVEAMLMDVPVLAYRTSGVPDTLNTYVMDGAKIQEQLARMRQGPAGGSGAAASVCIHRCHSHHRRQQAPQQSNESSQ